MDPYQEESPKENAAEDALRREQKKTRKKLTWAIIGTAAGTLCVAALAFYGLFGSTLRMAEKYKPILDAAAVIEDKFIASYDSGKMTEDAIDGFLTALGDKWSYYVSPSELEQYQSNVTNSYVGIGVTVEKKNDGDPLTITAVTDGGGAQDAGLVVGDQITAVEGTSLLDLSLTDSRALIVGEAGTKVTLSITHADGSAEDIQVERRKMVNNPIEYEMDDGIGYIRIKNFNEGSADGFIAAANDLISQGAKGFVFDVRFNGGGQVTELTKMLDYLLPEGEIFRMVDKEGNAKVTYSDAACISLPMATLVNDNTYSAAEFFAEALSEYGVGKVVGTHTTGKGYAQASYYLSDGSCLVLSSEAYYTPQGKSLADVGIQPDIELDLSDDDYKALAGGTLSHADDTQWNAAMNEIRTEIQSAQSA